MSKIVPFDALLFVPKIVLYIVLFGLLLRAKGVLFGALLRAMLSFVQKSWSRWCFLVLSFVLKIVVWMALAVTPIRLDSRDNVGVVDVRCR